MPAKSGKQMRLMMMTLHNPKKVHKKNKSVTKMKKKSLRDYAMGASTGIRG